MERMNRHSIFEIEFYDLIDNDKVTHWIETKTDIADLFNEKIAIVDLYIKNHFDELNNILKTEGDSSTKKKAEHLLRVYLIKNFVNLYEDKLRNYKFLDNDSLYNEVIYELKTLDSVIQIINSFDNSVFAVKSENE